MHGFAAGGLVSSFPPILLALPPRKASELPIEKTTVYFAVLMMPPPMRKHCSPSPFKFHSFIAPSATSAYYIRRYAKSRMLQYSCHTIRKGLDRETFLLSSPNHGHHQNGWAKQGRWEMVPSLPKSEYMYECMKIRSFIRGCWVRISHKSPSDSFACWTRSRPPRPPI